MMVRLMPGRARPAVAMLMTVIGILLIVARPVFGRGPSPGRVAVCPGPQSALAAAADPSAAPRPDAPPDTNAAAVDGPDQVIAMTPKRGELALRHVGAAWLPIIRRWLNRRV
jgi:hypothetical protein